MIVMMTPKPRHEKLTKAMMMIYKVLNETMVPVYTEAVVEDSGIVREREG